jgi:hypothetical protein
VRIETATPARMKQFLGARATSMERCHNANSPGRVSVHICRHQHLPRVRYSYGFVDEKVALINSEEVVQQTRAYLKRAGCQRVVV